MKIVNYIVSAALCTLSLSSCTDLSETLYDQVASENYYNTKQDVIRATFRPFEHAFWSIESRHVLNELTADQLITPTRDGWWDDGGKWRVMHYHDYNVEDAEMVQQEWNGCFQGIMQSCKVIEDLSKLSAEQFGFTQSEFNNLKAQCRVLRAWFYLRLLDGFRHVPLVTTTTGGSMKQVDPKETYKFIESELKECLPLLVEKTELGTNSTLQGQWTKAAAASLLVRLYLNAEVYIGEAHYSDCAKVAQDILDGVYGKYKIADRWDAAFDWDNDACDEVIFGFPASSGYTYWNYSSNTYNWTVPARAKYYLNDAKSKAGDHNCKYAASPSYAPDGTLYNYQLGMPIQKFKKYPSDERLKLYRNLGNSRREGMFLYGYLEYKDENGVTKRVKAPEVDYELYIRDAVGVFQSTPPTKWLSATTATLRDGDHNSGWHFVKYPLYSDDDAHQLESDYTEIRLPEIIYSLAECKLREGDKETAGKLLNSVRKRNYPEADYQDVLYAPEGNVRLDMNEMLDEWGREYFAESRRRIDLIRFDKFSTNGVWWDKQADADRHTEIWPITREVLNSNHELEQNPGYNK